MGIEIAERRRAEEERLRAESAPRLSPAQPARGRLPLADAREPGRRRGSPTSAITSHRCSATPPRSGTTAAGAHRVHPHDLDMVEEAAQLSIETGEPFQLQYRYLARDGRVVWVIDHATLRAAERQGRAAAVRRRDDRRHATMKEAERKAQRRRGPVPRARRARAGGALRLFARRQAIRPRSSLDYLSRQLGGHARRPAAAVAGRPAAVVRDDPPRRPSAVLKPQRAHVADRRATGTIEYRIIAADGSIRWLADRGTCVARDDRRPAVALRRRDQPTSRERRERDGLAPTRSSRPFAIVTHRGPRDHVDRSGRR